MLLSVISPSMMFPELFIVKLIETNGATVKASGSTIQIIRKSGKCEQVFKPCNGKIQRFISQYKTYRCVRSKLECDPSIAISKNWGITFESEYYWFLAISSGKGGLDGWRMIATDDTGTDLWTVAGAWEELEGFEGSV